jgi:hypothetical protein
MELSEKSRMTGDPTRNKIYSIFFLNGMKYNGWNITKLVILI